MCVFCKIIKKEIPSYTIYENDDIIAFLDITQATKGHTLIIPKKHIATLLSCDDVIASKLMVATKHIANHLLTSLQAKGINIISNINEAAGQEVMHAHIHVIPRYSKNDHITISFTQSEQDFEALQKALVIDALT